MSTSPEAALASYLANIKAKTGAEFEVIESGEQQTEYEYEDYGYSQRNHTYTKARVQLKGTRFRMTLVFLGNRWRRGRG